MSALEALILGIVQGATEFLPVSSSGHLVIGQALMGISLPGIVFEVAVHVATLLSVLIVYRHRLWTLVQGTVRSPDREAWRYVALLVVATIPAGLVGVFLGGHVQALFSAPQVVGVALLVTGALLFSTRWALPRADAERFGFKVALLIGIAQCFALVPGISRSGATVVTALWLGVRPVEAAAFSFLMSIPAIGGAALLELPGLGEATPGLGWPVLLMASVAAAVTGVLAIRTFVAMLRNRSFPAFAWYCWAVGLLFLGWVVLGYGG